MKEWLLTIAGIALALYIGGTLILGTGASSMKSQGDTINTNNATKMADISGW